MNRTNQTICDCRVCCPSNYTKTMYAIREVATDKTIVVVSPADFTKFGITEPGYYAKKIEVPA